MRAQDRPTEGQWWYVDEPIWNGNPRVMTHVPGCQNDVLIANLGGQRETQQNGRLMAASKELRRALIRLLKVTTDHVEACDDWGRLDRAQVAAREALNKTSCRRKRQKKTKVA